MILCHSCQVYQDNMFFTYVGTVTDEEGNSVEGFEFAFAELNNNFNFTSDENNLPQRGSLRVIYRVKSDENGAFKIVVPFKNVPRYYFMTLGGSRFIIENFQGTFESEVRDILDSMVKSEQLFSDLGQIKMVFK